MPRALAWTLDLFLRVAVLLLVMMVVTPLGRAGGGVVLLAAFFLEWLLPAAFEAMWNGQTPGKRVMQLRVLNDDGSPLRWPAALTRNLLRAADFLPLFYGVGLAAMLASRDFKRLGDLAAGTVVVYAEEKAAAKSETVDAAPVAPPFALSLAEQRALLELAERSGGLTRERLEELAALPKPLVGEESGAGAAERLLGMATYISGRQ